MSEKIRVVIVDDLPETRENVRKLLQFESDIEVIAQAGRGDEALEIARAQEPDIILMDINMPGQDGISASRAIIEVVPSTQIIIMSVQSEADYLRRAMLAGARDFLMKPFTGDELVSAIRRVHESRPALNDLSIAAGTAQENGDGSLNGDSNAGYSVAVYSPKGGCGCTTVAINLGVALASAGHNTLLVDASLQFGDVAVMLNMRPVTSIMDVIDRLDDLDADLISSVALKHDSGLHVLLAPPRPEMAEMITASQMEELLNRLRQFYDFIVVDTSSSLTDRMLAILDIADRVLLITQQSLPALTNASRFFDLTQDLEYREDKVLLVVNRASSKMRISVKDVANALKKPVIMAIPADDLVVSHAVNQGYPLVVGPHEKRPVADALNRLSERVLDQLPTERDNGNAPVDSQSVSRLARLFGGR